LSVVTSKNPKAAGSRTESLREDGDMLFEIWLVFIASKISDHTAVVLQNNFIVAFTVIPREDAESSVVKVLIFSPAASSEYASYERASSCFLLFSNSQ